MLNSTKKKDVVIEALMLDVEHIKKELCKIKLKRSPQSITSNYPLSPKYSSEPNVSLPSPSQSKRNQNPCAISGEFKPGFFASKLSDTTPLSSPPRTPKPHTKEPVSPSYSKIGPA